MKEIEPLSYFKRIKRKFELEPLYELNLDMINKQEGLDKRIEIAKLFIPEIEGAGPFNIRYDLAATMVAMLAPLDKREIVLNHISKHYKIESFYPWNIDCLKNWAVSKENYYHPVIPTLNFAHPALPKPRFIDFSEFLSALRIFKNIKLNFRQFESMLNYYSWKTEEFKVKRLEIDIINNILPFYSQDVEKINLFLKNLYTQGSSIVNSPKFIKDLVEKMGRDYKTVKRHLDELKSYKLLRQVFYVDRQYFGLETLLFMIPFNIRIKSGYFYRKYKIKSGNKNLTLFVPFLPQKSCEKMRRYVEMTLKIPINAYYINTIPIANYSFTFFNRQNNRTEIDWKKVDKHFKRCELKENQKDYEPVRAPKGDFDSLTLKIWDFISGNVNVSNQFLQQTLRIPAPKIKNHRKELEKYGLRFPYIYTTDWSETYFLKANTRNIGEINYLIKLLSIFPFFSTSFCQNIQDPKDKFITSWIHLPTGSFSIFEVFSKNKLPFEVELYYVANINYAPSFHVWEFFDDEKKEYNYDFNKIKITAASD